MSNLAARIRASFPQHVLRDVAIPAGEAVAMTARTRAPINSTGRPCTVEIRPLPLMASRAAVRLSSDRIPDSRWDYGQEQRRSPFPRHRHLDGLLTEDRQTDPRLTVQGQDAWLGITHYEPQDHFGCLCSWADDPQDQFITDAIETWPDEIASVL